MFFNIKSLNFVVLAVFTALSASAAEHYAATVEDGTAKVLAANTSVNMGDDENEVITEEHVTRRILRAPRKLTAKTVPVVVAAPADVATGAPMQQLAPAQIAAPAPVVAPVSSTASELADLKKRVEQLEKAEADAAKAVAKEELKKEAVAAAAPAPIVATPVVATPIVAPAMKEAKYDVVPDNRINEVAQRLKYANDILKRYGRAYDYRSTTLKEFKAALKDLEAAEEKTKAVN